MTFFSINRHVQPRGGFCFVRLHRYYPAVFFTLQAFAKRRSFCPL